MEAPTAEIFVKLPAPRMLSMTMMMTGKEGGRNGNGRRTVPDSRTERGGPEFTANIPKGET